MEQTGYKVELLVIDNNSSDRTKQIAEEKGARVIVEPVRGKGGAIRAEVIRDLKLDAIGFELEANMFTEIAKKGYRIEGTRSL
jgi:glycosyltransferase involved in cell wall biosynthesis